MTPSEELLVTGPFVRVVVGDPRQGRSAAVSLMIDTGAEQSVLDEVVLGSTGSAVRGRTKVAGVTSSTPVSAFVHRVLLEVDGVGRSFDVDVVALPRDGIGDGLLGRDILAHLRFAYDGPAGTFRLE